MSYFLKHCIIKKIFFSYIEISFLKFLIIGFKNLAAEHAPQHHISSCCSPSLHKGFLLSSYKKEATNSFLSNVKQLAQVRIQFQLVIFHVMFMQHIVIQVTFKIKIISCYFTELAPLYIFS